MSNNKWFMTWRANLELLWCLWVWINNGDFYSLIDSTKFNQREPSGPLSFCNCVMSKENKVISCRFENKITVVVGNTEKLKTNERWMFWMVENGLKLFIEMDSSCYIYFKFQRLNYSIGLRTQEPPMLSRRGVLPLS